MGWQGFEYADVVQQIATYLLPVPDQADTLGNLKDDYVSELAVEAILASRAFQKKGNQQGESRYVYKSLWNYARSQARVKRRRKWVDADASIDQIDPVSLEKQAEARSSIRRLQKNLDKASLRILIQLAEAEGDVVSAWRLDARYHRRYYAALVKKARNAAKKLLQN